MLFLKLKRIFKYFILKFDCILFLKIIILLYLDNIISIKKNYTKLLNQKTIKINDS